MNKYLLAAGVAGLITISQNSFALCTNGTMCPTPTTTFHRLRLVPLFNTTELDMSGNDDIRIGVMGSTNPMLVACVGGNTVYRVDDTNDGAWVGLSALVSESFLCLGDGDDRLTIVNSSGDYNCGGFRIRAFPYNEHHLHTYGQAGRDTIFGGDGDDFMCGGDGSDTIYGGAGDDSMDGWNGCDYLNGGLGMNEIYGYSDVDWIWDRTVDSTVNAEEGDDCLEVYSTRPSIVRCGPGWDGASVYPSSNLRDCEYVAYCPWDWPSRAEARCLDM